LDRDLENPTLNAPLNGFAFADLPPFAAIESASNMSLCTTTGNSSKAFLAALTHEIARNRDIRLWWHICHRKAMDFRSVFAPDWRRTSHHAREW